MKFSVNWTVASLTTIVAALAIGFVFKSCQGPDTPKMPPKLQKTLDSLEITKPAFTEHRDSVIRVVIHDTVRATESNARAESLDAIATVFKFEADSLGELARANADSAADSAAFWQRAYEIRTRESEALRAALVAKDTAYELERLNRIRLFDQLHRDSVRTRSIEEANSALRMVIAKLEQPCRVVGPIRCPSRTLTMVLTAITVGVAQNATKR